MTLITKIRHRIGKWLWKGNEWTDAVEQIEKAVDELRSQKTSECVLKWRFNFLSPPNNRFTCHIKIDN